MSKITLYYGEPYNYGKDCGITEITYGQGKYLGLTEEYAKRAADNRGFIEKYTLDTEDLKVLHIQEYGVEMNKAIESIEANKCDYDAVIIPIQSIEECSEDLFGTSINEEHTKMEYEVIIMNKKTLEKLVRVERIKYGM